MLFMRFYIYIVSIFALHPLRHFSLGAISHITLSNHAIYFRFMRYYFQAILTFAQFCNFKRLRDEYDYLFQERSLLRNAAQKLKLYEYKSA